MAVKIEHLSDYKTYGLYGINLLTREIIENPDEVINVALGTKCPATDFAYILGANRDPIDTPVPWGKSSIGGRPVEWLTWSMDPESGGVSTMDASGVHFISRRPNTRGDYGIRPVLVLPDSQIPDRIKQVMHDAPEGMRFIEVEYGEYPQTVVPDDLQKILNTARRNVMETGKSYTVDSPVFDMPDLTRGTSPIFYFEKKFDGNKYIKMPSLRNALGSNVLRLSTGKISYRKDLEEPLWIRVEPIKWILDRENGVMVSKTCLLGGLRLCSDQMYYGNFGDTELYDFLNTFFAQEIVRDGEKIITTGGFISKDVEFAKKKDNPYGLKFDEVSEEDIIRGAIETGVAVFLHGASAEGKSSRVKQIDPDCEIIYLRNATPESLNGKSVFNQETGEMIDIKPTWLTKLEEKCEKEPDKLHVVFFDEITNALPSIQGMAFNIVLDKEVNGKWKLPENARIVAAGNDMKDSLAANQLAEPLARRFAHVYIKTTTESWLKWASENDIHPAIYAYIAYRNGETLRTEFDGEKPSADPRKWEMASKMLYKTKNPEMLRALVGEDITREFVEFCNQQVITLDDVISDKYTADDIRVLNTAERYATTMGLSQVDEEHLEKVRNFVLKIGKEFGAIFDALWTHGDEARLERLAEAKLAEDELEIGGSKNGRK